VEVSCVQVPKSVERRHEVRSNDQPHRLEKTCHEAVGPSSFVRRECTDGGPDVSLGEAVGEAEAVNCAQTKHVKVDGIGPCRCRAQHLIEELIGQGCFLFFIVNDLITLLEGPNVLAPAPSIGLHVEELRGCISLAEPQSA
jgi:hypothetical protein